jgi:hypothetical protein
MDGERLRTGWAGVAAGVERELVEWREAHPRATLTEIEGAVLAALSRLQERYLSDLVHASAAADLRAPAAAPPCPACGGPVEPRGGPKERRVLTPRQAAPLRLRRGYGVCSACGAGLFPPG